MPEDIFQLPSSRLRAFAPAWPVARGHITPPRGIHSRCWGAARKRMAPLGEHDKPL